jgi:hypothetical protein
VPYINCLELSPSQLASTFGSGFFLLLVRLNLGFILRETCRCAHHTFLLGFPTGWLAPPITCCRLSHAPSGTLRQGRLPRARESAAVTPRNHRRALGSRHREDLHLVRTHTGGRLLHTSTYCLVHYLRCRAAGPSELSPPHAPTASWCSHLSICGGSCEQRWRCLVASTVEAGSNGDGRSYHPRQPVIASTLVAGSNGDGQSYHPRRPVVASAVAVESNSDSRSYHQRRLVVASVVCGWEQRR